MSNTRVMMTVEAHSRKLLHIVCTQLLGSRSRADKLILAQVHATNGITRQQESSGKRIVENFESLALGEELTGIKESNKCLAGSGMMCNFRCPYFSVY